MGAPIIYFDWERSPRAARPPAPWRGLASFCAIWYRTHPRLPAHSCTVRGDEHERGSVWQPEPNSTNALLLRVGGWIETICTGISGAVRTLGGGIAIRETD